jgi:hypothetical protein
MTNGDEVILCKVCGVSRGSHLNLRHVFSIDGSLTPMTAEVPRQNTAPRVMVANAVDVQLRELLIAKGILTHEDFGWSSVHSPRPGDAGDQGTGGAPPTG